MQVGFWGLYFYCYSDKKHGFTLFLGEYATLLD